ncbi:MAG: carbonic anhydrase family protein [Pirellulaceae bacterium]
MSRKLVAFVVVAVLSGACLSTHLRAQKILPSWNDGDTRQAIINFVTQVTDENGEDFVPVAERIAVFDNDGTLWSEKPFYFQLAFAIDRIRQLADQHPEWQSEQPFQAALQGDTNAILAGGEEALLKLVMASHADLSTAEFEGIVRQWIDSARHPETGRLYKEMVYQPMLELLNYLRANGFRTWIVSGGGIEFMRPWAEEVYGVPPEQVIGSSIKTRFEMRDEGPVLLRLPELDFIDDKAGKPVAINKFIGRRPIAAFGNSDGDLEMLQWTMAGPGPRFGLIVHHTDAEREWAYNRNSAVGRLDAALDQATLRNWTIVDMQNDWLVIYPYELPTPSAVVAEVEHHYFAKEEKAHTAHWSYEGDTGPAFWGRLDPAYRVAETGEQQSPVNIESAVAEQSSLPTLKFDYRPEMVTAWNNGHTIQHNEQPGSFLHVGEDTYALEQFHVHMPSEHTIDGKHYDMEIHFVHKSEDGRTAVVGVMVEAGEDGVTIPPYSLPGQQGEVVVYNGRHNPSDYLPRSRQYFGYNGSFTTPPCTEGVLWLVMIEPVQAPQEELDQFREILKHNNRPVQPLNGRQISRSR